MSNKGLSLVNDPVDQKRGAIPSARAAGATAAPLSRAAKAKLKAKAAAQRLIRQRDKDRADPNFVGPHLPKHKRGGTRPGAGQKPFEPTEEQRTVVKLLAGSGRPQEVIALAVTNPHTKKPMSVESLQRHFAHELEVGGAEMDTVVVASMAGRIRKGSDTMIIWYTKNKWGWRDHPEATKVPGKGDEYNPAAGERKIVLEVIGGLPRGSTPEKPEGDDYSDVPPEEESK